MTISVILLANVNWNYEIYTEKKKIIKQYTQAEIMTQKHATVFLCYVSHGSHMRCGIIDVIISYFQV